MPRDFFDPPPEKVDIVLVDAATIRQAESIIDSCENCSPAAEIPFDWLLDRITGRSGAFTDYILGEPGKCPVCRQEITERTLIVFAVDNESP
jgi:hypothetical protein